MNTMRSLLLGVLASGACAPADLGAEEPLHRRIDAAIAAAAGDAPLAPRSSDAEFLRRVHLDLAGRIPTATEVRGFLADESPDKRAKLIDRLLAAPDYPRQASERLHVMLMERLGDHEDWQRFLRNSFEKNVRWDVMARAMLHADREDENGRGAAYFLTSRLISEGAMADTDVAGLTRDVGRLLAGRDLQCAECHDHVSIDDYKQRDFQGLHAIFLNVKQDRSAKFPALTEGLMSKKHEFMSVFVQQPEETGPRVPGAGEITLPEFAKGEEYLVPPDRKKRTPGVPKFSPLAELAKGLTRPENEVFRENAANRFWFLMLGRGLVHPLDLGHGSNPPSHPKLLQELGRAFAEHEFDVKWLLREIALSETYQRTSVLPAGRKAPPADRFALALQKRISAEHLLRSTLVATGERNRFEPANDATDAEKKAAGERLDALRKLFVKAFANPPREPEVEFEPSVKGTLLVLNGPAVLELFERRPGNLVDRLAKLPDEKVADELFPTVLSRPATPADRADVAAFLAKSDDRDETLGQLAWALWSSNEFFLNH